MVPSTFSRLKAARCLPVVLAALIFAGCGTHTPDQSTAYMQGTAQADSAFYLQQMQQSSDDTRINWQLLAIRALVKEGKTGQAVELFNQLPQELNDSQRREKTLLAVEIKLAQKDFAGAQNLLAKITPADLEQNQQARYWQAKIDASQGRPSIDLLRALIAQEPLLGAKEKQQNIDATWQALSSMTQEQANTLVINADENILQGWLDLQRVWFDNRNDPDMMKAGIADWQKRYPNNPGAKMLPTQLVNVKAFKPASTNKIALLLPLNGQAAVFGRTIQQGFEAAKNIGTQPVASPAQASVSDLTGEQPAAQPAPVSTPAATTTAVSAPANPSAELKIYDTSSQPLSQILSQVQQDGASIVVGPLLKNNVEELLKSNTPLNVLALNQPENIENRVNICYFALSPEDE
ncbi:MAG: penicillin-binding protein activator, partial [Escherichia coli]|nr:penicillin-binding protein activator [Escherichia coli]